MFHTLVLSLLGRVPFMGRYGRIIFSFTARKWKSRNEPNNKGLQSHARESPRGPVRLCIVVLLIIVVHRVAEVDISGLLGNINSTHPEFGWPPGPAQSSQAV